MPDFNKIDDLLKYLISTVKDIDLKPIFPKIRQIIETSIDRNFSEGGRYGNDNDFGGGSGQWKKSRRAVKEVGQTLVDTGQLAASIRVNLNQSGKQLVIEIGSNKTYAAVHQFGFSGDVTVKRHTRKVKSRDTYDKLSYTDKKGKSRKKKVKTSVGFTYVRDHTRKMNLPARPFLVLQEEDIEAIKVVVAEYVGKKVK